MEEQVDAIIAGGASVFVAGLGVPREVVDQCHRAGVLVMNMCGKVRHAEAAVDAGCDVVIAQGTEAGGHTGTVATQRSEERRVGNGCVRTCRSLWSRDS